MFQGEAKKHLHQIFHLKKPICVSCIKHTFGQVHQLYDEFACLDMFIRFFIFLLHKIYLCRRGRLAQSGERLLCDPASKVELAQSQDKNKLVRDLLRSWQ